MCSQISLCLDAGEDVGLAQHEQILPLDLDLGPAVLAVKDLVALLHVQRDALAVLVQLAVADGEDLALLRLLLGGIGQDEATCSGQLLLDRSHDQTIAQGLELHVEKPPSRECDRRLTARLLGGAASFLALPGRECQRHPQYIGLSPPIRRKLAVEHRDCQFSALMRIGAGDRASERRPGRRRASPAQFWAPPKPFIAWVIGAGLSTICEKRTTVTTSSGDTPRP